MTSTTGTGGSVVLGIDLGGTGTRFVALDEQHEVTSRVGIRTPHEGSADEVLGFLSEHLTAAAAGRPIAAIGIGASGPVDPDGTIRNPDTLPAFTGLPLVQELGARFGVPVAVDNDAVAAAIAEYEFGAGRGAAALLHVTLGTGIGTALLLHGSPFRGGDGRHPEGGHLATSVPSSPCYCGRTQCWEQAASRSALQAAAADLIGVPPNDVAAIEGAAARARSGDPDASALFVRYGIALADGLATLLELYRPTDVVLGGSAAVMLPLYESAVRDALDPLRAWIPECRISASTLDDFGGAQGAAVLGTRAMPRA